MIIMIKVDNVNGDDDDNSGDDDDKTDNKAHQVV